MKKKSYLISIISALCIIFMLAGCGSKNSKEAAYNYDDYSASETTVAYDYYEPAMEEYSEEKMAVDANTTPEVGEAGTATNRKLIKTVDLNVETKEFDALIFSVEQQVNVTGGYIENSNIYNNNYYSNSYYNTRSASYTVRIPSNKLDEFIDKVEGFSNVTSMSQSTRDVTLDYVDVDSHKKSLQVEQTRLLELMENADSMEDILVIEERLEEIRYQIESMESQLRTYDNLVDYSTVYISIEEVKELTVVNPETDGERLKREFLENIEYIGEGIKEFGIGFVVNIPFILIWAVIIVVIVFIIKAIVKGAKKKSLKKQMMKQEAWAAQQAALQQAAQTQNKQSNEGNREQ